MHAAPRDGGAAQMTSPRFTATRVLDTISPMWLLVCLLGLTASCMASSGCVADTRGSAGLVSVLPGPQYQLAHVNTSTGLRTPCSVSVQHELVGQQLCRSVCCVTPELSSRRTHPRDDGHAPQC